jgi:carbon-monoxide dehydrogenase medium subunit
VIPEAVEYVRPDTLEEALEALAQGATPLAGGHSLLPTIKLRLGAPERLVDIGRLRELKGITVEGDELVIGAATRYVDVLASDEVKSEAALLHSAVATIGDPQVRNRGTLGGAVAYGDAHGDAPTAVLALDATIVLRGPEGERRIAADDFFLDYFETARAEDELVTAIRIPRGQSRGR